MKASILGCMIMLLLMGQAYWSCSYQREDGVIVQFGDVRSPQQQWLDIWSGSDNQQ